MTSQIKGIAAITPKDVGGWARCISWVRGSGRQAILVGVLLASGLGQVPDLSATPVPQEAAAAAESIASTELVAPWSPPPLQQLISPRDGRTGATVTWEALVQDLSAADVVFLGETHDDDTTHRLQLALWQEIVQRRQQRAVLAMEMFERDVQGSLDRYLAGDISESEFLASARPWGNYSEAYRPLVEHAKQVGVPVIASNFPRPLRMRMMQEGPAVLDKLGDQSSWAPAELLPNSAVYWKRTDNAIRGHAAMMGGSTGENDRLTSTQSLWDNSMGDSCVKALKKYPGHSVVHLNGGFHSEYWDGTVGQVRQRMPEAQIRTVAIRPSKNPAAARWRGAPVADYVVFVESRGKNLNDGSWGITTTRQQKFRLHVPAAASSENRVPLLIWLGDDDLALDDHLQWARHLVGEEAAILVLEAPYRQQTRDLRLAGRWFWSDTFSEDIAQLVGAVQDCWQYSSQYFPVDPQRVVVAGEGTGGTVAAAVALLSDQMSLSGLAWRPTQFLKLQDFPLPLREDWGDHPAPQRRLQVSGQGADQAWWEGELKQYAAVGIQTTWSAAASDPWEFAAAQSRDLRQALGLPERPESAAGQRQYLPVSSDSAIAWHWSRLAATRMSTDGRHCVPWRTAEGLPQNAEPVAIAIEPQTVAQGAAPLCPGPFGGTTVLVVPGDISEDDWKRWLDLETQDPLNKRSRFHRLRVAKMGEGSAGLDSTLAKLLEQNRKNILIVPAQFCATAAEMQELERLAAPWSERMTLHWLPGLGGSLGHQHP